jgi:hypothetical protein
VTQVTSASEATRILFDELAAHLPVLSQTSIDDVFREFAPAWRSPGLIRGSDVALRARVLANLEKTMHIQGFHFFAVGSVPQMKLAQVMTFSDSDGASVCLLRGEDSYYLFGNCFFE